MDTDEKCIPEKMEESELQHLKNGVKLYTAILKSFRLLIKNHECGLTQNEKVQFIRAAETVKVEGELFKLEHTNEVLKKYIH